MQITIRADQPQAILIGHEGEYAVDSVLFDVSAWAEEYGEGTLTLVYERPGGDPQRYPVVLSDNVWTIGTADTAYEGRGAAQLTFELANGRKKSCIFDVYVAKSFESTPAPDPYETWMDALQAMAALTQANAQAAEASAEAAETSKTNAAASEAAAKASETAAATSEANAAGSAASAAESAGSASSSATAAATSENNAAGSASAAAASESNAATSATQAAASATSAANSEASAAGSATSAGNSASAASGSASAAAGSAASASESATSAAGSASSASGSATAASASATASYSSALDSEAWAVGQKAGVDVPATDARYHNNSKYYAEQASGSATAAAGSATAASGSATSAGTSATSAAASAQAAQDVLDSIPADYSALSDDVSGIRETFMNGILANDITPESLIIGEYVKSDTGEILSGTSYSRTDFISINGDSFIKVTRNSQSGAVNALCFYDSTQAFISGVMNPLTAGNIIPPNNAKYIIVSGNKSTAMPYVSIVENVYTLIKNNAWCRGKMINWIGDSIVDGADFDEEVCNTLMMTKLTTDGVDGGINGSTIALKEDGTDERNAICLRYSDMPDDADVIAVSAGTNDWMYAWCSVGTIDSTENTTFYGALKTLCEGLITKYPQKVIFFTTPIKRAQSFENGNGGEYTADGIMTTPFSKNKYGKTLGDYADIIKEVCGFYSIPVLDMYRESLLNPHIGSQQNMFDSLLTHPNAVGQKIMARRVCGWLVQLGHDIP